MQGGTIRPGLIVALVGVSGVVAGLGIPAWQSFVAELVPRESLLNAVTLNSAQFNVSRAIGFMLGGFALYSVGPGLSFLVNALSYPGGAGGPGGDPGPAPVLGGGPRACRSRGGPPPR